MKTIFSLSLIATGLSISSALAHHGGEFLIVQSHSDQHAGDGAVSADYGWEGYSGPNEDDAEVALYYNLIDRVGIGVDTRYSDEGEGWAYSSVMPMLHLQLTDHHSESRFKIGVSLGYQFAEGHGGEDFEDISMHTHDGEDGDHHGETEHGHGESGHSHGGSIHNHDVNQWMSRISVGTTLGKFLVVGNLITTLPEDDHAYWGYGFGIRRPLFVDELALGLEAMGDFEASGYHEIIASAFYDVSESLTLRLGVGHGLGDQGPDGVVHAGFVWKF